jgi:hypothetical protein
MSSDCTCAMLSYRKQKHLSIEVLVRGQKELKVFQVAQ